MSNRVTFTMTDFRFPPEIRDAYATYRIYFELTYRDSTGKLVTVKEIMPGAGKGEYFECEKDGHKDSVRYSNRPKIDLDKITNETWKRVVFNDLNFASLDELVVGLQDVEKDSKLADLFRKILKEAFPIAIDLALGGKAFTIGNALAAINAKDPAAKRSTVETKFDEVLERTKKANKTRPIMDDIIDLDGVKSGTEIIVSGKGRDYMVDKHANDLLFESRFRLEIE